MRLLAALRARAWAPEGAVAGRCFRGRAGPVQASSTVKAEAVSSGYAESLLPVTSLRCIEQMGAVGVHELREPAGALAGRRRPEAEVHSEALGVFSASCSIRSAVLISPNAGAGGGWHTDGRALLSSERAGREVWATALGGTASAVSCSPALFGMGAHVGVDAALVSTERSLGVPPWDCQ